MLEVGSLTESTTPPPKRRRRSKGPPSRPQQPPPTGASRQAGRSYAAAWELYVHGHAVSETNAKFIRNMLMASATSRKEEAEDPSEDSEDDPWPGAPTAAGSRCGFICLALAIFGMRPDSSRQSRP